MTFDSIVKLPDARISDSSAATRLRVFTLIPSPVAVALRVVRPVEKRLIRVHLDFCSCSACVYHLNAIYFVAQT